MQLQGEKTLNRFFLEFSIKQLFVLSFSLVENPSEKQCERAKQLKKDSEQVGMTT